MSLETFKVTLDQALSPLCLLVARSSFDLKNIYIIIIIIVNK